MAASEAGSGLQHFDFSGKTILVVDDIDTNREAIASSLGSTNVSIVFAENGIQAVDKFKAAPVRFGAILMDVQMPEMDGFEASRSIRGINLVAARKVPIIAMTANIYREDIDNAFAAGMNDHIAKPIDANELRQKLNTHLNAPRD